MVDDVVARRREVLDEDGLELESRVVRGDVDAHGGHCANTDGPRAAATTEAPPGASAADDGPVRSAAVGTLP
ncbi:hypothetical protein GCM10022262_09990 [Georgenia daeguensis]|uniref:Uncharacterized protein n=1 Tax=Georgenia daeguensis TaxID=908355 RepID=A0ABP8ERL4_9MICO